MALLIGVAHSKENTERVLRRLNQERVENKKVMLEIFSNPIVNEVRERAPSFANFFEGIAEYALTKTWEIICGDDKTLYYRAIGKMAEIGQQICALEEKLNEQFEAFRRLYPPHRNYSFAAQEANKSLHQERARVRKIQKELIYERDNIVPFTERDPHFAKVVGEEKPGIIILGSDHIPYLVKNYFPGDVYSVIYIPPDSSTELLKREVH